jgi:hypothetical protein
MGIIPRDVGDTSQSDEDIPVDETILDGDLSIISGELTNE